MSCLAYCSLVSPSLFARETWLGVSSTVRGFAPLFLLAGATTFTLLGVEGTTKDCLPSNFSAYQREVEVEAVLELE